jgi:hypothetical protein
MRLIFGVALYAALLSTFLMPVAAALATQVADATAILEASARAMDSAQSMSFSGSVDITVTANRSPIQMSMPMSGAYQAPDRLTMSFQMPQAGGSMDMIMISGQMWMRTGQGPWRAQRVSSDAYASPLGKSHAEWFRDLTDVAISDVGGAYRVTATMDVAQAMSAGYSSALGPGAGSLPIDLSTAGAQVTLTIDKATSYIVSMKLDMTMPVPDLAATMVMTMNMNFSDFDSLAAEILPPV